MDLVLGPLGYLLYEGLRRGLRAVICLVLSFLNVIIVALDQSASCYAVVMTVMSIAVPFCIYVNYCNALWSRYFVSVLHTFLLILLPNITRAVIQRTIII